jgi:SNF2 family DNA or RNA helicase
VPIFLKAKDDHLAVTLAGLKGPEFSDALTRVKSIPGRAPHYEGDKFICWKLPKDPDTAMRAIQMLQPSTDAEVEALVKNHAASVADNLVTKLPEDAELKGVHPDELRPYQRSAIAWLAERPHSILADEMGTGKTLQALSVIVEYIEVNGVEDDDSRVLIVCPNAVRGTWADEIDHWLSPAGDAVTIIDGKTPAKRRQQLDAGSRFVIVNWEKIRLMPELAKVKWLAVIADEAHRAKNRKAKQTKALWKLRAPVQLALTGTPIMSSPDELWSILRWLRPKEYTGFWPFHYSYVDEYPGAYKPIVVGVKNADQLRFELADKLVRRTKKDVLPDLPDKVIQRVPVPLHPAQRKLYREAEKALFLDIAKALEAGEADAESLEGASPERLQYLIPNGAARVTRLRQIVSTPALLGGEDVSAKFDAAVEIVRDNPGKPFVIFTWFADSARILAERLRKGKPSLRVDTIAGDDDADPVKDAFQAGDLDVVVATIAKGGTGLTLTAADTAIFIERDWTPAMNVQAEDRLHRIGQENRVTILVLESPDTIDTGKIAPANKMKELIASQVLGEVA